MRAVRTVLGDIAPGHLGVTDSHDHLFLRSPRLPGQELEDLAAATAEARAFKALGGGTIVQWTPWGMGRRLRDLAALSRDTGVHVVAATGLHQAAHYDAETLRTVLPRLAETFTAELTEGRAGLVKVAGGFHGLDAHARRTLTAAATAHHATGAPIAVHHELGTAALDVLDLLCGELAVPPGRVLFGHLGRNPDLHVHRTVAEAGAYLVYDGPSRANHATDWRLFDTLATLTDAGHAGQLLLGGDTTTAQARAADGEGPGIPYLLRTLRPRIADRLGEKAAEQIFVANPGRAFGVEWSVRGGA